MLFTEERKLKDDEYPLLVQLNWGKDDREGRFLLKNMDEKTHLVSVFASLTGHLKLHSMLQMSCFHS